MKKAGYSQKKGKQSVSSNSTKPDVTKSSKGRQYNGTHGEKELAAKNTFARASLENRKRASEVLQSFEDFYESSSDEDNLDDVGIIEKLTKSYKTSSLHVGDAANHALERDDLGITAQYLIEACQSGAITCLVCISKIKRQNEIWSCINCYGIFHIKCITQWVMEGVKQTSLLSDELFPNRILPWYCPKCRKEYSREECPEKYYCFCGKVEDPPVDRWLVPHSCGGICNKMLQKPLCGHRCLLLCHPGPCPPCPKIAEVGCYCGKKAPVPRRCGTGRWSCGQPCKKLLNCQRHKCMEICHDGACSPCEQTALQSCRCGTQSRTQLCANPQWSCEKKCGSLLSCGYHRCDKVCHNAGECGDCSRAGLRTCPCGKEKYEGLTCKDDVKTCEDTCDRVLNCYGDHRCSRKCHFGDCGPCPLVTRKHCRCKRSKRDMPCSKEFSCDVKCSKMRSCGKHQCKRKCCAGRCPPCEQLCNKLLQCKKHKCQMPCHQGPCYPCLLTSRITCNCGKTGITVVCGKQSKVKPPRCRLPCSKRTNCHHPTRVPHPCHFGKCPDCVQICSKPLPCGHACPIPCHDNIVIKNEYKPTAPWEKPQKLVEIKALPCRPCKFPVSVICRGKHETAQFACCDARDYSCGKECGRPLRCGNHTCSIECHVIGKTKNETEAGSNCEVCERPCAKPRPPECQHTCVSTCHSDPCGPCRKPVKTKCHCGMVLLRYLCYEWIEKSPSERERVRSCGNYCPKLLPCNHPCPSYCHPGACPPSSDCKKKVFQRCPCKRRKQELLCFEVFENKRKVECDNTCKELKEKKKQEKAVEERKKRKEEEKRQQHEIEKYDRWVEKISKRARRKPSVEKQVSLSLWDRVRSSRTAYISLLTLVIGIVAGICVTLVLRLTQLG